MPPAEPWPWISGEQLIRWRHVVLLFLSLGLTVAQKKWDEKSDPFFRAAQTEEQQRLVLPPSFSG
jgi:hypothetical protein